MLHPIAEEQVGSRSARWRGKEKVGGIAGLKLLGGGHSQSKLCCAVLCWKARTSDPMQCHCAAQYRVGLSSQSNAGGCLCTAVSAGYLRFVVEPLSGLVAGT